MILLVLVVLLWVAVLAPSAWRRFGERQGVGSIDHFHHQLQLLEHAGPKTVAPAYRLHTAVPGRRTAGDAGAHRSTRPAPSWCCSGRPTTRQRPTSTTEKAATTSGSAYSTGRSRCACPRSARTWPAFRREAGPPPLHHAAALPRRGGDLDRADRDVARDAPGLGVHRARRAGGPRAGRADGLRQGARSRTGPAPARRDDGPWVQPTSDRFDQATAGYPGAWDDDDFEVPRAAAR